jgi:hypothetical protein
MVCLWNLALSSPVFDLQASFFVISIILAFPFQEWAPGAVDTPIAMSA